MIMKKYFSLDFNAKYIIHFLDGDNISSEKRKELEFRISQLDLNKYLKVLKEVIPSIYSKDPKMISGMKLSLDNFKLFFDFIDFEDFPFECISNLDLKHNYNIDNSTSAVLQNYKTEELLELEEELNNENGKLLSDIIEKLEFQEHFITDDPMYYFNRSVLVNETESPVKVSIIKFIIEKLKIGIPYIRIIENEDQTQKNYNIISTNKILKNLYGGLSRYDFINENKTSQKDFMNALLLDWDDHKSTISLEMNNPQTQLLFNSLNEYLNIKIPLTQIELSKKIENKNGLIKANSIYASVSKSKNTSVFPKNGDLLIEIVKSAKKG